MKGNNTDEIIIDSSINETHLSQEKQAVLYRLFPLSQLEDDLNIQQSLFFQIMRFINITTMFKIVILFVLEASKKKRSFVDDTYESDTNNELISSQLSQLSVEMKRKRKLKSNEVDCPIPLKKRNTNA